MAIRNIRLDDDPILRKKSREVTEFNERLFTLLDDMKETMYQAEGVGLAAVQVGVLKRVVVIDCGDNYIELINPEIVSVKGHQQKYEGCLSLPHKTAVTERPMSVKVKAQNRLGEIVEYDGEDLLARCFCHEIDHLDGILFTDRCAKGYKVEYDPD